MRKYLISVIVCICFISTVSQSQPPNMNVDMLQNMLFGVSTLKGVQEVYPQVQIEVLEAAATQELRSSSKIGTLVRNDIYEQVVQDLKKAGIKIAQDSKMDSENAPLSLNITIFIKVAAADPPIYNAFIYTEGLQSVRLGRENSIRSFSRTWPMQPMALTTRNMLVLNASKLEDTVKEEVAKQINTFINDFTQANPNAVPRNAAGVDIESLRKTLLKDDPRTRYGAIRNNDPSLQAVQKLESAGSEEAISVLLEFLTNNKMDRKLKQHALTSLGKIGTEPAIEAIKKFEDWSQKRYTAPQPFYMGLQEFAIDHFASLEAKPLIQTKDQDNKTWALIILGRYGGLDLWLTSLFEKNVWSEPIFLNLPDFSGLSMSGTEREKAIGKLQVEGDTLKITYNNVTHETRISDQLKDTDKDGLTDFAEARFLTDPKNHDSDGDGVPDGKDSNPLTPKHKETNDMTEIRQAVFSALFATTSSQNTIVIVDRDEFAKQEYYGFAGAVLQAPKSRDGFVNVTSIDIKYQSDTDATASISDWEGSLAASGHEVKLKRIHGKWVVVEFGMTWIS